MPLEPLADLNCSAEIKAAVSQKHCGFSYDDHVVPAAFFQELDQCNASYLASDLLDVFDIVLFSVEPNPRMVYGIVFEHDLSQLFDFAS